MSYCGTCFCLPSMQQPEEQISLIISDVCITAKTGDIVLFSGTSWTSWWVEAICASQWSHIGIVIEDPQEPGDPFLFESVSNAMDENVLDVKTHTHRSGVRLVRLAPYLENFRGNCVALRTLQCSSSSQAVVLQHKMRSVLGECVKELHGRPYERRWIEFIFSRYRFFGQMGETPDSFYCSELIAWCYMCIGLLNSKDTCSNQYLPDDFCEAGSMQLMTPVGITGTIKFSQEYYVRIPRANRNVLDTLHMLFTNPERITLSGSTPLPPLDLRASSSSSSSSSYTSTIAEMGTGVGIGTGTGKERAYHITV